MSGKGVDVALFVPKKGAKEDDAEEEAEETDAGESKDSLDTLLGHAFDAYEDGDRAGFIRSLRAAIKSAQ